MACIQWRQHIVPTRWRNAAVLPIWKRRYIPVKLLPIARRLIHIWPTRNQMPRQTNARPRPLCARRVWKCWIQQINTTAANACWRINRVSRTRAAVARTLKTVWIATCWGVAQMRAKMFWINVWPFATACYRTGTQNQKAFWLMRQNMRIKMPAQHAWHGFRSVWKMDAARKQIRRA